MTRLPYGQGCELREFFLLFLKIYVILIIIKTSVSTDFLILRC
jgi:hypothetical protein